MKNIVVLIKALIIVLVFSFVYSVVNAETIYLKSGKTIEGKVVEKTDKYIKIDFQGMFLTYFLDEIEKIEEAEVSPVTPITPQTTSESRGELYVNEEYGFQISGPKGWFMHIEPPIWGTRVLFNKTQSAKETMPGISISVDNWPKEKSLVEFGEEVIAIHQKMGCVLIEPIKERVAGSTKAVSFVTEGPISKYGYSFRVKQYIFKKEDKVISVMYTNKTEEFQKHLKDFEQTVNTFKFITPEDDFSELRKLTKVQLEFKPPETYLYESLKKQILDNMETKDSFKTLFVLKDKTKPKLANNDYKYMEWLMVFVSPKSFEISQSNYYHNVAEIWRVVGDEIYIKIGLWIPLPTRIPPAEGVKEQETERAFKDMVDARKEIYKMLSFAKYLELLKKEMPVGLAEGPQDKYTVIQFRLNQIEDLFPGKSKEGSFNSEVLMWVSNKDKTVRLVKTIVEGKDKEGKEIKQEYEHYFSNYNFPFKLGKPKMPWRKGKK